MHGQQNIKKKKKSWLLKQSCRLNHVIKSIYTSHPALPAKQTHVNPVRTSVYATPRL